MKIRHLVNAGKTNPKRTQTNPIKANLKKAQINVNKVLTKEYEKMSNWALYENEPNSNPNKANACPPSVWRVKTLSAISVAERRAFLVDYCKLIDDYSLVLYTGVLYKKNVTVDKK